MAKEGQPMEFLNARKDEAYNAREDGNLTDHLIQAEAAQSVRELEQIWKDKLRFEEAYPEARQRIQIAIDELERIKKANKMEPGDEERLQELQSHAAKIDAYEASLRNESKKMAERPFVQEKLKAEGLQEDVERNAQKIVDKNGAEADEILAEMNRAYELLREAGGEGLTNFTETLRPLREKFRTFIKKITEGMEPDLIKAVEAHLWDRMSKKLWDLTGTNDTVHASIMQFLEGKENTITHY